MKTLNDCFLLPAALLALTTMPLLSQSPPAPQPSSAPAADSSRSPATQLEDKETAEDAALLEKLDADAPPMPVQKHRAAPLAGGRGGGRAMAVGQLGPDAARVRFQVAPRSLATPKALLIRTTPPDAKAQAELKEDLAVMAHLLLKSVDQLPGGQPRAMNALGIELAFPDNPAPVRSLYLDGYGAVFFLSVGFPLVAPPETQPEQKPATADSAWEDAREDLYGQRTRGAGERAPEYSQERVDKLKQTLLEALKNASNIREMKPEESITVWVVGNTTGGPGRRRMFRDNPPGTLGGNFDVLEQPTLSARRTILTIRAHKSEIDSYAKGSLTPEEFAKRVQITAYAEDGASGTMDVNTVYFMGGRR